LRLRRQRHAGRQRRTKDRRFHQTHTAITHGTSPLEAGQKLPPPDETTIEARRKRHRPGRACQSMTAVSAP
jgi:hypothetical protein